MFLGHLRHSLPHTSIGHVPTLTPAKNGARCLAMASTLCKGCVQYGRDAMQVHGRGYENDLLSCPPEVVERVRGLTPWAFDRGH